MHHRPRLFEQSAVVAGDAADIMRLDANAIIGKDGEGGGVLEEPDFSGAERHGQIGRQGTRDPEAPGRLDHVGDAHLLGDLDRGDVPRACQRAPQRDDALEFFVVVVRRIGLTATDGGERSVEHRIERRHAFFDGSGVNVGLERAAHLSQGLCGPIELRLLEAVTAHHRFDLARGVFDRHQRRLRCGLLV